MDYKELFEMYGLRELSSGTNEDGENVIVHINEEYAQIETLQKNGWCRVNIYWKDGTTEELYKR